MHQAFFFFRWESAWKAFEPSCSLCSRGFRHKAVDKRQPAVVSGKDRPLSPFESLHQPEPLDFLITGAQNAAIAPEPASLRSAKLSCKH